MRLVFLRVVPRRMMGEEKNGMQEMTDRLRINDTGRRIKGEGVRGAIWWPAGSRHHNNNSYFFVLWL